MMPLMMMMNMANPSSSARAPPDSHSHHQSDLQRKIAEMQKRQEDLIDQLVKAKSEAEYTHALKNPALHKIDALERKIELMRKNKLKQKEEGGMPKFLMYMQQNLMNQAMLQAHMNEPDPTIEQHPRIVPVAVDPRKRIMPFSTNPFIKFEMNKPAFQNKDLVAEWS
jgi:hypothetical protein